MGAVATVIVMKTDAVLFPRVATIGRRQICGETPERSRLRCRDIMTRDLAVATRDTTLPEIALMMKQEDTGVIPVVEYDTQGNGRTDLNPNERKYEGRNYTRGKLVGLITDRDIVVRAVADNKDCASVRAEDIMSVDIHTANPNDRVVDAIRKMGDKQVRRIPITNDNGYLVGMVSMADVAIETRQDRELADAIEDISKGTSFWNRIFG
jgi:CBS domain-containing protein